MLHWTPAYVKMRAPCKTLAQRCTRYSIPLGDTHNGSSLAFSAQHQLNGYFSQHNEPAATHSTTLSQWLRVSRWEPPPQHPPP